MISSSYIDSNLRQLDYAYRSAKYRMYPLYFAKLALLELCGWIEMSMDDIVRSHAKRKRLGVAQTKFLEETVISRTWGFEYNKHFKGMLVRLLGVVELERLEAMVDPALDTKLRSNLTSLARVRGSLAHTYVKGVMTTIDAPSVTRARFPDICAGLRDYETKLRSF